MLVMDQDQLEALLGRELTTTEVANISLYLDIASDRLKSLICSDFSTDVGAVRKFESRAGYRTVFIDIFEAVTQVKVDGIVTTDYEYRQFDNLNGNWYNSLVFNDKFYRDQTVEVTGNFGFSSLPADMQLLLGRLFDSVSEEQNTDSSVQSQRIDDAQVTFKDGTVQEHFYLDNKSTIDKYSICAVGYIRHGKTWRHY